LPPSQALQLTHSYFGAVAFNAAIAFRSASEFRNRYTNHESKFDAFREFVLNDGSNKSVEGGDPTLSGAEPFVIQFICHPNFNPDDKEVAYYEYSSADTADGKTSFQEKPTLPPGGYKRKNSFKSFKNYVSTSGHPNGLFYELNLYTKKAAGRKDLDDSNHSCYDY